MTHLFRFVFICFIIIAWTGLSKQYNDPPNPSSGTGNNGGFSGECGYPDDFVSNDAQPYVMAAGRVLYGWNNTTMEANGAGCGACFEIYCDKNLNGGNPTTLSLEYAPGVYQNRQVYPSVCLSTTPIYVRTINSDDGCGTGNPPYCLPAYNFDLTYPAYEAIANWQGSPGSGSIPISWKRVDCPLKSSAQVRAMVMDINAPYYNYVSFVFYDLNDAIGSVVITGKNGQEFSLTRKPENQGRWLWPGSVGNILNYAPFEFTVKLFNGEVHTSGSCYSSMSANSVCYF